MFVTVPVSTMENRLVEFNAPDWSKIGKNWGHLQDLPLSAPVNGGKIRLILGTGTNYFHRAVKEKTGSSPDDPVGGPGGFCTHHCPG